MAINGIDEKILFQRANSSVSPSESSNRGVLVIDPNKVVNEYGEIKDRYVKQEDLLIYASLKVFKKDDYSVTYDGNEQTYYTEINQSPIYINFLNPLSNRRRNDGTYESKNKLTTDWTDFFTDDAKNNSNNSEYILDPEIFGITNIAIKINASFVPIITIEFTDVQGRTLFERGNDENNPYNIFFTYPYPRFLLTYKGYYGRAIETKLVLLKSNTKYDPSSGNYNITAEFQSDIFAFLNTFLLIYGYVAPYMFKTNDGQYLGKKILSGLYDKQNKAIRELVGEVNFPKYEIIGSPTLYDLGNALKKINSGTNYQIENDSSASIDIINQQKITIDSYSKSITDFFANNTDYKKINSGSSILYQAVSNDFKVSISNKTPIKLFDYIQQINNSIKTISEINISDGNNSFYSDIINNAQKNINLNTYVSGTKISVDSLINGELFLVNDINNPDSISLNNFEILISIVKKSISKLQASVEENYISEEISELKSYLGYEPNLDNVNRIIANNMQVFLILLDLVGRGAIKQIKEDIGRSRTHYNKTGYKIEFSKNIFSAFPTYYKVIDEFVSGNQIEKKFKAYPGEDTSNENWFEVAFVDEIYASLDRLKEQSGLPTSVYHNQVNTGILSVYQLGEDDLSVYTSSEFNKVIGELLQKFSLYFSYSGFWNRNLKELNSEIIPKLAEFEFDLIKRNVVSKIVSSSNQFVFVNEFKNYTRAFSEGEENYTNLGNLGLKKIFFGDGTSSNSQIVLTDFVNKMAKLFSKRYSEDSFKNSFTEYTRIFKKNNEKKSDGSSDGVRDRALYKNINFENLNENLDLISFNSNSKLKKLNHLADLSNNLNYFCDTFNLIEPIATYFSQLDGSNDVNFFQGFYENLNLNLSNQPLVIDFSRGFPYALSQDVPPLTFNSKISDQSDDNKKIFDVVSYSGSINYSSLFNRF